MAVPKRKMTKARRDSRRANWKLTAPGLVECPQCHEMKMPHRVCPECGYYNGKAEPRRKSLLPSLLTAVSSVPFLRAQGGCVLIRQAGASGNSKGKMQG